MNKVLNISRKHPLEAILLFLFIIYMFNDTNFLNEYYDIENEMSRLLYSMLTAQFL